MVTLFLWYSFKNVSKNCKHQWLVQILLLKKDTLVAFRQNFDDLGLKYYRLEVRRISFRGGGYGTSTPQNQIKPGKIPTSNSPPPFFGLWFWQISIFLYQRTILFEINLKGVVKVGKKVDFCNGGVMVSVMLPWTAGETRGKPNR